MNKFLRVASAALIILSVTMFGCEDISRSKMHNEISVHSIDTVDILSSPVYAESYLDVESESLQEESMSEENYIYSEDEIDLISLLTVAEAEDEPEFGKRLVIDTVLNRVDSDEFPDSIEEVIFQPYQFPSMTNGRASRCFVTDDVKILVKEEMEKRTDSRCLYFNAEGYLYGDPLLKIGNHYFSGREEIYYE